MWQTDYPVNIEPRTSGSVKDFEEFLVADLIKEIKTHFALSKIKTLFIWHSFRLKNRLGVQKISAQ